MVWRLKIRKMRSWGNSSEKALNALGNYVKRKKNLKILKYFIFQIQLQLKILISWKGLQRLNQINTGLCWQFFRIFSICSKNRKLQCLSPWYQSKLDRNIFARGGNQGFDCKWLVGFNQGNLAEIWPNIMNTIWLVKKLITISQLYGNLKVTITNRQFSSFSMYATV